MNPSEIKLQIDQLLLTVPELAEDEVLRADMLEAETKLNDFMRMVERKRQEAVQMVAGIKSGMDELGQRRQRFERRDEALRSLMFKLMQWANLPKMELPEATISIRAGVPKVVIVDEAELPKGMLRIVKEPDKLKIKAALQDGKNVKGAALSNAEPCLSIRIK